MNSKIALALVAAFLFATLCNAAKPFSLKNSPLVRTKGPRDISSLTERQFSSNSICSAAQKLTIDGEVVVGDTTGSFFFIFDAPAVIDAVSFFPIATQIGAGVWYEIEGTGDVVSINTCFEDNLQVDPLVINIFPVSFENCSDIFIAAAGSAYQVAGNCASSAPTVDFLTIEGQIYKIYVSGSREGSKFQIQAVSEPGLEIPENINPDSAIDITGESVIEGNNYLAPVAALPLCNLQGGSLSVQLGGYVFYKLAGTGAEFTLDATREDGVHDVDLSISVYTKDCDGEYSCVAGGDDVVLGEIIEPIVSFVTEPDVEYLIAVYTYGGTTGGEFTIKVSTNEYFAPENQAPVISDVKLSPVSGSNEIEITYNLVDDDSTNGVNLYVMVADSWVLIKSGLSGEIGQEVAIKFNLEDEVSIDGEDEDDKDGDEEEEYGSYSFRWHGALSGNYWILLKANDEEFQVASEPVYIHVSYQPDVEAYEAECSDDYPYIPFEKVISWFNWRGEVTLEDGRHVVYQEKPVECGKKTDEKKN